MTAPGAAPRDWPTPDAIADRRALADALSQLPLDGLTRTEAAVRIQLIAKGAVL
ncbi:hypothetical protein [Streptomyces sioyaensis]|uniref:hypothetical protein n=1 Tax=Streptomyces sioyaensis TaxID=67364 RepID=UPI003793D380